MVQDQEIFELANEMINFSGPFFDSFPAILEFNDAYGQLAGQLGNA